MADSDEDVPGVYVLGADMARARHADDERVRRGVTGPGVLGHGARYDRAAGDDLFDPVENSVDRGLHDAVRRFRSAAAEARSELRAATSMDDFYTLLHFAKRCAVFGMRERNVDRLVDGLTAVAIIDPDRIDLRDEGSTLGVLAHAGRTIDTDAEHLFAAAAALASPENAGSIASFLHQTAPDIHTWGFTVTGSGATQGLLHWGGETYEPSAPLDRIAIRLANVLRADRYRPSGITVGSALPQIWLSGVDDAALEPALRSVRGGATVHAELRDADAADGRGADRSAILFLVEVRDAAAAEVLARLAERRDPPVDGAALLGVRHAKLFCLLVARPVVVGLAPVETPESVRRFAAPIAAVLQAHP